MATSPMKEGDDMWGQFFDVVEEMNYPSSDEDDKKNVVKETLLKGTSSQKKTIIEHFFKTMERMNLVRNDSQDTMSRAGKNFLYSLFFFGLLDYIF